MLKKRLTSIIISILIIIMSTGLAIANAPEGKGDGTGGGENTQLSLTGIKAEDSRIELVFSKNVTNIRVKENNAASFEIKDSDGNPVAFEAEIPDDQLEREKRRDIYLNLAEPLQPEKEYELTVKAGFMAKNGEKTEKDIVKDFRLGTDEQMEVEQKEIAVQPDENPSDKFIKKSTWIIVGTIVVLAFGVMIVLNRKKRR